MKGRVAERQMLDRLIDAVRSGESRVLVLRGEAGIGKSALMDYLADHASGCRVLRAAGVESEMELAFAGLHQLFTPIWRFVPRLPDPQQHALGVAFGLAAGRPPDRFLLGVAALSLLSEAARERPVACLIDDVQWLDQASRETLLFAARRLVAESVAMIFAIRDSPRATELGGLPEMVVAGLAEGDARELLASVLPGAMDQQVLDRILAEAHGNPLALLELPRVETPGFLVGGYRYDPSAVPSRIEESYRHQVAQMPRDTRRLLVIAAAESTGDPVLVWRAARAMGISTEHGVDAPATSLVEFGTQVRFRHPLVRSAILTAAAARERMRAHRSLAEATDPVTDPDRRAWHMAQATSGTDEDVALELEHSADRAYARGGWAAAAAFLHRATELTPDLGRRAERALAAAQAAHHAGSPERSLDLLALAEAGPLDDFHRAQVDLLRGRVSLTVSRGGETIGLLLKAARQLERFDVSLARDTYLDALMAAMFAGHLAPKGALLEVVEAARVAPRPSGLPQPADLLLEGLVIRFTDGYGRAVPVLQSALVAFHRADLSPDELRWLWLARITAGSLWDERTLDTARSIQLARESGALATLPLALATQMGAHVLRGELEEARSLLAEVDAVGLATGIPSAGYGALLLAAWSGTEDEASALIEDTRVEAGRRGEGFGLIVADVAQAILYNGLGRYEDALAAAKEASRYPPLMAVEPRGALVELIEAATRTGHLESAADALRRLRETTQVAGTDFALGIEARSRALVANASEAEAAYLEAIERLSRTALRGELARAHLLYGEWLRRQKRPGEAKLQLGMAHDMFVQMGMRAFEERAARELEAAGERIHRDRREEPSELTAQEAQVARLAREGLSNAEIAARLFISPRTVEWHLGKVFGKLGITSRRQLRR